MQPMVFCQSGHAACHLQGPAKIHPMNNRTQMILGASVGSCLAFSAQISGLPQDPTDLGGFPLPFLSQLGRWVFGWVYIPN